MCGVVSDGALLLFCSKHCVLHMEWRGLSHLSYENVIFENTMHGPTLCSNAKFTKEDRAILDNLILEQEDVHVARGVQSPSSDQVEDDCVIMHQPLTATPKSSVATLE